MLKQRQEQIHFFVRLMDLAVGALAFFGAYWLRTSPLFFEGGIAPLEELTWMLGAGFVVHFFGYPILGFYRSLRMQTYPSVLLMILKAAVFELMILGTLIFLLQEKTTSRYFFGFYLALNYLLIFVVRFGAKIFLSVIRTRGYNFRQMIVIGSGKVAEQVVQVIQSNKSWGYRIAAVLKTPDELKGLIQKQAVDEVFFAQDDLHSAEISEAIFLCETLGIPARIPMNFFDLPKSKITFSHLDEIPVITFYTTLMTPFQAIIKRSIDIIIAIIGLMITAVLYPWISWRIKRESPGPVIFKQKRVGENGRIFKCYKFRTMNLDAEERKKEFASSNMMDGPLFKLKDDPRVTKFGAFLRRTSLDELPQFFNILRGDMSVVGTRPPTPDEVEKYQTHFRRRLSIRPGLTGLWQVSGRNKVSRFEDVLALDLKYIDSWSIWLDLRIIVRTIYVVLFRRGAY